MKRRRLALGLSLCAVAMGLAVACSGGQTSHVFQGHLYVEARDCYEKLTAVDVLQGPDPGLECDAVCLVGSSPLLEAGESAVYVTNACAPYPPTMHQPNDATCQKALGALARGDLCNDTGSLNPLRDAGEDAAPPADAGEDAAAPEDDASVQDASIDAAPIEDAGDDASPLTDAGEDAGDASD